MDIEKRPKIEMIEPGKLIGYINNAKKHPESQIRKVMSSIKEFGFLNPILIDHDFGIIAGHCRCEAALKLELHKIPCIKIDHLTKAQKKAYILADNKLSELGIWDNNILDIELQDLSECDFNLDIIGFDGWKSEEFEADLPETSLDVLKENDTFKIIVTLNSQDECDELFDSLKKKGYKVKAG